MRYEPSQVTILVPVYCPTPESLIWLDECLASCVPQNCEIICYNDGSPQDPYEIISKYPVQYYGHTKNNGVSFARNRCAENAATPLIFPIDCDDKFTVPDAISTLLKYYDGTPLYCDLLKFGMGSDSIHALPKFNCAVATAKLGFSSVNVLHSVEQWKSLGGWDESLHMFEDAEYNGRLMISYCGDKIPLPLIAYRQHETQRTRVHKNSRNLADTLLARLKEYETMGKSCCGKGRRSNVGVGAKTTQKQSSESTAGRTLAASIPGQNQKLVQARYVGGLGKGPHYYKGPKTKYAYRVEYGAVIQADRSDTRAESDRPTSLLVRLVEDKIETKESAPVVEQQNREPRTNVEERQPVIHNEEEYDEKDTLPDITNLSHRRITQLDITPEIAAELLAIEKRGKNRVKVVYYLEGVAGVR